MNVFTLPCSFFFEADQIADMMKGMEKSTAVCHHCCQIKPIERIVRNRALCPECCEDLCRQAKKIKTKTFKNGGMKGKRTWSVPTAKKESTGNTP